MPRYHIPREKKAQIDISKYPDGFECGENFVVDGDEEYPELEEFKFELPKGVVTAPKLSKAEKAAMAKAAKAKPKKEAPKSKRGRK